MRGNVPRAKYQGVAASKFMAKRILDAKREVQEETNKQVDILYHASAIVLHRYHGWTEDQITTFYKQAEQVGEDCTLDYETSMVEMLWDETGIELMAEGCEKHWYEVSYLNSEMDVNRMVIDQFTMLQFYKAQLIWAATQVTASMLISLHRIEDWKPSACRKFLEQLEKVKYEYDQDGDRLREVSFEEAGVKISDDFWNVTPISEQILNVKETESK